MPERKTEQNKEMTKESKSKQNSKPNNKIHNLILKYALHNAIKFKGKASPRAVLGKILAVKPELKKDMKFLTKAIDQAIKEINNLPLEKQIEELKKIAPELLEEKPKKEEKRLPELKNAQKGKVIMRFEPSPSGPLHIGHAITLGLNALYCKKYNGKLILRIADTNPENIDVESYDMIINDAKWLLSELLPNFEIYIQSERLGYYYDYAEKLISMEKAYVCTCNPDEFRTLLFKSQPCPCRNLPKEEHLKRWDKMFVEYKPGEAVVRIKTDLSHKNPAIRDWAALRICEKPHPKNKDARVWPLMNFSVAIDDMLMGVTHTIRGKDHQDNAEKQSYVFNYFNKTPPTNIFIGRINFVDLELSASKTRKLIEYGEFEGWSDIRLPFLAALRRRGYQPNAFIKLSESFGISKHDKLVDAKEFYKILNAFNKDIIDPKANRYFFVPDPILIEIKGTPEKEVEINFHPDFPERGTRKFRTKGKFYLWKDDFNKIEEGNLYRLMDCLNFKKQNNEFIFDSEDYEKYKKEGKGIFHWLPAEEELVNVELLMPNKTSLKGVGENSLKNVEVNTVVQLERIGFARLDSKQKEKLIFWFAHK